MSTNKITNGNFSAGLSGWTVGNPTGGFPPGAANGTVSFNRGSENTFGDFIEQSFTNTIGQPRTLSLDLIEDNGGNSSHDFRIEIIDSNNVVIATLNRTVPNNSVLNVSLDFTPTTTVMSVRIANTGASNGLSSDGKVDNVRVVCFVKGTQIAVPGGTRPVESLKVGDLVETADKGPQKIRWIGARRFDAATLNAHPKLRPVRITAGALGNRMPERDLLVSRQHRMLVSSVIAERILGDKEALVAAIKLTALPGIFVDENVTEVAYFHILLDQHEVIFAEGAPTESLLTGTEALEGLTAEARAEIIRIFPDMADTHYAPRSARLIPQNKIQKNLIARHARNQKPLLDMLPVHLRP